MKNPPEASDGFRIIEKKKDPFKVYFSIILIFITKRAPFYKRFLYIYAQLCYKYLILCKNKNFLVKRIYF